MAVGLVLLLIEEDAIPRKIPTASRAMTQLSVFPAMISPAA